MAMARLRRNFGEVFLQDSIQEAHLLGCDKKARQHHNFLSMSVSPMSHCAILHDHLKTGHCSDASIACHGVNVSWALLLLKILLTLAPTYEALYKQWEHLAY